MYGENMVGDYMMVRKNYPPDREARRAFAIGCKRVGLVLAKSKIPTETEGFYLVEITKKVHPFGKLARVNFALTCMLS